MRGFEEIPDNIFPFERLVTCGCERLTTGQLIADTRCTKVSYPKNSYLIPGPIPITVMLQHDFFELNIVDNETQYELKLRARALFGTSPDATLQWMRSFMQEMPRP